jgi:cytochrome c556
MKKALLFVLVAALACVVADWRLQAQTETSKLMAKKLKSAQAILEGVVMADYKKISKNAEELIQISKTAEWQMIKRPRYEMFSNEFRRAAENLIQKSADKNIDGAALAYMEMTLTCVRCHQYVRDVRDVKLPNPHP